ncbi:MAG: sulfurtransferase TusA family protein [Armatimonadota bacterium]
MSETIYRIPESVVEDARAFRHEVEKFLAGDTSPVAFRALRVPMGIYEQRENDTYMVRIRGAAGVFSSPQVALIADLAEEFGDGTVHVTTRQDLQIHRVLVQDTPTVLERLIDAGLSTRGGGGNTVRNVSACPHAGICLNEAFDVTAYALALTEYLITDRANFNLPRKFKAAFSGCGNDHGLASVADLGFFAHEKNGARGFSVYAGGGMGAHSAIGALIEEFVPAEAIFEVAEAVKRLFDKYGDRTNRSKARLRFVVERFGPEEFRRMYERELEQVRREGISTPEIRQCRPKAGLHAVNIHLEQGLISASSLLALADAASRLADGELRATQHQGLQIRNVPESNLQELREGLETIDRSFLSAGPVKCVSCAGASTCKLGLCLSRGLASAIEAELRDIELPFDAPIRISGCPNSCGHHPIAPLGLYGGASRTGGRLYPAYFLSSGGRAAEGDARLGQSVGKVPARAVPVLLKEFWTAAAQEHRAGETLDELISRWGTDHLRALAEKYEEAPPYEESPEYYRDFGSADDFSLAGRGPGECGAGVMDVIALDTDEAKRLLQENRLYDAVVATARALLVTKGLEPKKDREIFAAFSEHLVAPGWVGKSTQGVLDAAVDYKLGDRPSLDDLRGEIEALLGRVEVLFRSLDSNLSFRVEPVEEVSQDHSASDVEELDLRGVACPMNFVRAKIGLEEVEIGGVLDVLLDGGEPVRNVPASFADQGQEVLSVVEEDRHFRARIKRIN